MSISAVHTVAWWCSIRLIARVQSKKSDGVDVCMATVQLWFRHSMCVVPRDVCSLWYDMRVVAGPSCLRGRRTYTGVAVTPIDNALAYAMHGLRCISRS